MNGEIDGPSAERFTNAAFTNLIYLEKIDPKKSDQSLSNLNNLSPNEYRNVAYDSSYLMMAPRLDVRHRDVFRKNQDVLTPMISIADPSEWDQLIEKFQNAMPRVAEIARDTKLGPSSTAWFICFTWI